VCLENAYREIARGVVVGGSLQDTAFMGGEPMSIRAAEQHEQAAAQYGHAARYYQAAAAHHQAGQYEKAAHHVQIARGHHAQATTHVAAAAKSHAEYYEKP
jgi:hypothetical protein